MKLSTTKPFTGYHMASILIGFFGIVIAVNIYMAKVAIGTFGGTVVDNSYVASQNYNEWLAEADRQNKLGWSIAASRAEGGKVALKVADNGTAGQGFVISARAIHPLGRAPEQALRFEPQGNGNWLSVEMLSTGRWTLHFEMRRDTDHYRTITDVK